MKRAFLISFLLFSVAFYTPSAIVPVEAQSQQEIGNVRNELKQMDLLMGEHTMLASQALMARYSNLPSFQGTKKALDKNTDELSVNITDFYSEQTGDQFKTLWNRYNNLFIAYTDARRRNDGNRQARAISDLQEFTEDISSLLSRGNSDMFRISQNYFAEHILNEKSIIDAYASRDYDTTFTLMHEAYLHAATMTEQLQ